MSERSDRDDGREVAVSNPEKILFPQAGLTKRDLVNYYRRIAPIALAHYRDRAVTLHRFPEGIAGEGFYQKHTPDYFPEWIRRIRLAKEDGEVEHVVVDDAPTLAYLANQACITLHLALARCARPNHPDRLVFDLDPSDRDFAKVRFAALEIKRALDRLSLVSFVQTTGSRGLHVVVPLDQESDFDVVRAFARRLAERLAQRHPEYLTTRHRKDQRGSAVFIDYLRNAYGQTAVAPYAVRALEGAPVATPVQWAEVERGDLRPDSYSIRNVFRRLGQMDDPWADLDRYAQSLDDAIAELSGGDR